MVVPPGRWWHRPNRRSRRPIRIQYVAGCVNPSAWWPVSRDRRAPGLRGGRAQSQIFLSLVVTGTKMGVAVYESDSGIIHVMDDTEMGGAGETVYLSQGDAGARATARAKRSVSWMHLTDEWAPHAVLDTIRPSVIITSTATPSAVVTMLRVRQQQQQHDRDAITPLKTLEILPLSMFNYDACRARVRAMQATVVPAHISDIGEREMFLSALLSLECPLMVGSRALCGADAALITGLRAPDKQTRALGSLLKFLETHRIGAELDDARARVPVLDIRPLSMYARATGACRCGGDAQSAWRGQVR